MLSQLLLVATMGKTTAACAAEVCAIESASFVQTSAVTAALLHREALDGTDAADPLIRPSAGKTSETVEIGVICNAFYGLDLKAGTATMDIVTSMSWTDQRVVNLIPEETPALTLSERQAQKDMWLPDLTISNRDIGAIDKLSSAVTINTKGVVQKVDRMIVTVRNRFDDRSFPWDSQEIVVRAGSATHMKDDLVFVASQEFSGADSSVFSGKDFALINTSMTVLTETSGALEKSRARFGMTLRRVSEAYVPSLILPEVILAALGNSVFFLPLIPPFVMPRVASSIISVLSVLSHRQAAVSMTPMGAGLSWLSVFDEAILVLVFSCCLLNVLVEGVMHTVENTELATQMNGELQKIMPTLTTLCILVCFIFRDPEMIEALAIILRILLVSVFGLYSVFCFNRVSKL